MDVRTGLMGLLLCGSALVPAAYCHAQSSACDSALINSALEGDRGAAPKRMFHGISYDPSVSRNRGFNDGGTLQVDYRYGRSTDGKPYVDVEFNNRAPNAANYTLNLSTQRLTPAGGDTYRLNATVSAQGIRRPVQLGLGFQFYKADGSYLSDWVPASGEFKEWSSDAQQLSAEYVGGAVDASSNQVPASFFPRVSIYNLPPDANMRVRLSCVTLTAAKAGASSARVAPLKWPLPEVAPGQVLPFSVIVSGKPDAKAQASRLVLRNAAGKTWAFDGSKPLSFDHWGPERDEWLWRVPANLPLGSYEAWYELPAAGVKTKLGDLRVASDAGMWVGQAIHHYPGPSEEQFGPIQGSFQFVRSLASDYAYLMQWWTGPDEYDWKALSKWVRYHAEHGNRKVVMTFSGSPRWASSRPNQPAAMGVPGNAAPPAPEYRKAYQRMVKETVARFKDRILATECWNEPNSPDFFTGTQTDLADLCKSVYTATKSVDPKIPVICPQADDPSHLDIVYSAKTSAGEPIVQFCDVVGAHIYNRMGRDANGRDYAQQTIEDGINGMLAMSRKYGIDKPIAVTEYGLNSCVVRPTPHHPQVFGRMASEEASESMYRALSEFRAYGVWMVALYSYDHENNDPKCRPGGSYMRMIYLDRFGRQQIDTNMVKRVSDAVSDFGRAGGH